MVPSKDGRTGAMSGPLLVARAQAHLDGEERRGQALLGQLAAVGGAAGVALTLGATVLITLLPRRLPLQHVWGIHLGTILSVGSGVVGFVLLVFVTVSLLALGRNGYGLRPTQELITSYHRQIYRPTHEVAGRLLLETRDQLDELARINADRQLLLDRVVRMVIVGFVSIAVLATIMLFGTPRPVDVTTSGPVKIGGAVKLDGSLKVGDSVQVKDTSDHDEPSQCRPQRGVWRPHERHRCESSPKAGRPWSDR
jgi:hypothetical protein